MAIGFYSDPPLAPLFNWMVLAVTAYFTVEFLRMREYDGAFAHVVLWSAIASVLYPLGLRFAGGESVLAEIGLGIVLLAALAIIAAGFRALGRSYPGARFFIVGSFGGLLFGFGFPWQALWFTIALADRVYATAGDNSREARVSNAELQILAELDPLTGVPNRRAFDEHLTAEWNRALLTGGSVGVIMMDVDHFKEYNDHLGHVAGDLCLSKIAQACAGALKRNGDFFARYGGEEFAAVLSTQNDENLVLVAERMRQAVVAEAMEHPSEPGGLATISLGTARMKPTREDTPMKLVEAADEAMYEAKARGRNCVRAG
ncbi:MAG: GGDEF domain-containing protein [Vulcanimicrobiaceae bacterium]